MNRRAIEVMREPLECTQDTRMTNQGFIMILVQELSDEQGTWWYNHAIVVADEAIFPRVGVPWFFLCCSSYVS